MRRETAAHFISGGLVAAGFIAGEIIATRMPAGSKMPVHFGASGAPDQWAAPALAVAILPFASLCLWILFGVLSARAHKKGAPLDSRGFVATWLATLCMLAALQALLLKYALGGGVPNIDAWIMFLVGSLLGIVGLTMGDLPRNSAVGIRVPWTMKDERVWRRTHAFGRIPFLMAGLALYILAITDPMVGLPALVGVLLAMAVAVVVLALVFWLRLRDHGNHDSAH